MLGQCLIISAKHLSHFKVPVGKQELRILVATVTEILNNINCQIHVALPLFADVDWTLRIELGIVRTEAVPNIDNFTRENTDRVHE